MAFKKPPQVFTISTLIAGSLVTNLNTGYQNPPPFPGIWGGGGGGTGYLLPPVKREPAINVDMVNELMVYVPVIIFH